MSDLADAVLLPGEDYLGLARRILDKPELWAQSPESLEDQVHLLLALQCGPSTVRRAWADAGAGNGPLAAAAPSMGDLAQCLVAVVNRLTPPLAMHEALRDIAQRHKDEDPTSVEDGRRAWHREHAQAHKDRGLLLDLLRCCGAPRFSPPPLGEV